MQPAQGHQTDLAKPPLPEGAAEDYSQNEELDFPLVIAAMPALMNRNVEHRQTHADASAPTDTKVQTSSKFSTNAMLGTP